MPGEVIIAPAVELKAKDEVQDPVYLKIRDLVYQACGIYHSEEKLYLLVSACKRRMNESSGRASTGREYLELLTSPAKRDVELRALMNEITIGETCLFRSQPQLNALHNVILPELAAERSKIGMKKLRVWSAGCSTGEEPYALAMFLLEEKEKLLKDWTFEIQATDLNDRSVEIAREGVYGDYALRNTPELYKRKYFNPVDGGRLKVRDEVKTRITFTRLNLNEDSRVVFMKGMDLIFCCAYQRRGRVHQLSAPQNRRRLRPPAHPHHSWRRLPDRGQSLPPLSSFTRDRLIGPRARDCESLEFSPTRKRRRALRITEAPLLGFESLAVSSASPWCHRCWPTWRSRPGSAGLPSRKPPEWIHPAAC